METVMKRVGRFQIEAEAIESNPDVVQGVMGQVIVLRAEHLYIEKVFDYLAYSPEFDEVPPGEKFPTYEPEVGQDGDGNLTITWKRQD